MTTRARPIHAGSARAPAAVDGDWFTPTRSALIYFVLALIFFLPAFLPGRHIYGTDYLAGGYFFYDFIAERLSSGELPKWVPYIFGGLPMAANPGSTYHPVHLIAELILPTDRVLAAIFVVHFWIAGFGGYLLARELGARKWISFTSGIAYQFTGILASWVYAGHDGRVIVASVGPLLFFFLLRGVRSGAVWPFAGAAAAIGIALLSFQIQNSYYLLLGAAIWGVFLLIHHRAARSPIQLARLLGLGIGSVAFGFLLASVNFLPFIDYIPQSPRGAEGGRGYEYSTSFSMPPSEILSVAVPEHHGASVADPMTGEREFPAYTGANPFKLHTEYLGALVLSLLVLGGVYVRRNAYWWFFAGLGLFALSIAFGGNTPVYRLYYELLPGTKQFRAPSLAFFMVAMSAAAMCAIALERVAQLRDTAGGRGSAATEAGDRLRRLPWWAMGLGALALLGMVATAGVSAPGTPSVAGGWGRFALFALATGGILWLWVSQRLGTTTVMVLLPLVTIADLWVVGRRFVHTVDPPAAIFAADDVTNFLQANADGERVWMFPFPSAYGGNGAYGGDLPMMFGIEQVGGEHPNMLQRWNEYVGAGTETYIDWHNFVLEPAVVETETGQALRFSSRPGFMEAANVRYVVALAPLVHPALREVHRGSAIVYEHTGALPRAYLVPRVVEVPRGMEMVDAMREGDWNPAITAFVSEGAVQGIGSGALDGAAEVREHTPDRVAVQVAANRGALLVLADNFYDGWAATVDGNEAPIIRVNHTFRGVVVPAGEHVVTFTYAPADLRTGLLMTIFGFALLVVFTAFAIGRARLRGAEAVRSPESAAA